MEERAVAPVLGELILIAMAAALAASVGLVIYSYATPGGSPNVNLILQAENHFPPVTIDGENVWITITHQGGEVLNLEDLSVLAEDNKGEMIKVDMKPDIDMDRPDKFSLGEKVVGSYHYGPTPHGKEINVEVIYDPSRILLLSVVALITSGG